jgi:predicted ATPase
MLGTKSEAKRFADFMRRVGLESGLFENIDTKVFGDNKADTTAPFEVDAVVDGKPLNLTWVGYGVSQSLPILVELLDKPEGSWFAIQQPEVHLHPRAQASLGDVFFEMAVRDKKCFLIETHSDFALDRFRMNFRSKKRVPESQVLFFERRNAHNIVTSLPIGPKGDLPADQPDSYRNFFLKEEMRVIGL